MPKQNSKSLKNVNEQDLRESLLKIQSAFIEAGGDVKTKASELMTDLIENLENKKSDYENDIREYVAEKPIKSLGIALGLGILIGKIIL